MKSNKILSALFSLIGAVTLVIFFQNCGQSGSIAGLTASEKSSGNTDSDPAAVVPVVDAPPVNNDDDLEDPDDKDCIAKCGNIKIMSVNLAADVVSNAARGNYAIMAPVDAIIIKEGLNKIKVKALADDKNVSLMKIILDLSKSYVVDDKNVKHEIIVPSGEQSGLKFNLSSKVEVKKDVMYEIEFEIKFESQFVRGGKACKFKPVIHSARFL